MYYEFFKLKEHPFRLTCETKFFYLGPEHTHANSMMEFALIKRQGLMLLTGEVGTGKTMLVQHFLSRIDENHKVVLLNQTQLSELEFFQMIYLELAEEGAQPEDKVRLVFQQIVERIEQLREEGKHTIIIVDEAQNLEFDILIRLFELSQKRIDNEKICTLYLVGQNKLRESLDDPAVKDFISTINTKYHLGPLNLEDIRKYIYHRLAVAGGHKNVNFDDDVFPIIETYTGGRPRLINVLVDHILTYSYLEDIKKINSKVVDEAINDLQWLPFGVRYGEEQPPKTDQTFKEERRQSYKLVINSEDKITGEYFIRKKRITIGRHRENDLRIDDALISRQHAQIIQQGRTIYLRDLNSTNGTFVGGKRVDIAPLEVGTKIKIGSCELTFTRSTKNSPNKNTSSNNVLDYAATHHS
ncbi:MAG: FHA domain-containing protein [Thioalkalispiraceae bacterium]